MKPNRLFALAISILALGFLYSGCSKTQSASPSIDDELTLNDPYGGYTDEPEAPSFGEVEISQFLENPTDFNDNLLSDADFDSIGNERGAKVYGLVIRWGILEGDSSITTVTDWSGSAEVSQGIIGVRRFIRFEPGQDYIVRPRQSRSLVEWVSKTTVHYDGLLLMIVEPPIPNDSAKDATEKSFTIKMGPYSRTFSLSELESLDEIVDVDNLGNQISFTTYSGNLHACGGGPLNGFWAFDDKSQVGRFFGSWMSENGRIAGHLRGHFGVRGDARVFYAKVIGLHGEFMGFFRGHWWTADSVDHGGGFEGAWIQRNGKLFGTLSGRWSDHRRNVDDRPDNGGFFAGWWKRACVRTDIDPGT